MIPGAPPGSLPTAAESARPLARALQVAGWALVAVALLLGAAGIAADRRHGRVVQLLEPFEPAVAASAALSDGQPGRPVGRPLAIVTFRGAGLVQGGAARSPEGHPWWSLDAGRPLQRSVFRAAVAVAATVLAGGGACLLLAARGLRRLDVPPAEEELALLLEAARAAAGADEGASPPPGVTPSA